MITIPAVQLLLGEFHLVTMSPSYMTAICELLPASTFDFACWKLEVKVKNGDRMQLISLIAKPVAKCLNHNHMIMLTLE